MKPKCHQTDCNRPADALWVGGELFLLCRQHSKAIGDDVETAALRMVTTERADDMLAVEARVKTDRAGIAALPRHERTAALDRMLVAAHTDLDGLSGERRVANRRLRGRARALLTASK